MQPPAQFEHQPADHRLRPDLHRVRQQRRELTVQIRRFLEACQLAGANRGARRIEQPTHHTADIGELRPLLTLSRHAKKGYPESDVGRRQKRRRGPQKPPEAPPQTPQEALEHIRLREAQIWIHGTAFRTRILSTLSRLLPAAERAARRGKPALLRMIVRYALKPGSLPHPRSRTP